MIDWFVNAFYNLINEFTTPFGVIVQIISIVGTLANVLSLQFKKAFIFYSMSFFGSLCFMVHFALLGAWGGCFLNGIIIVRSAMLMISEKAKTKANMFLIFLLFVIATVVIIVFDMERVNRWYAVIPCIASFFQTMGVWCKNPKNTRWFQILGASPGWMLYNVINSSLGGIISDLFMAVSGIVYLVRHRKDG